MAMRRSVVLRRRPQGMPAADDFEIIEDAIPTPAEGEIVTRTIYLSLDPYMRGRLSEAKSYAKPVAIGEVMTGETVGEVVASAHPDYAPGDIVVGPRGWSTHCVSAGTSAWGSLSKLRKGEAKLSYYLGILGMPGVTAYSGMKDIGQPKAGETVVVSAASGAVGSVVGQLAKRAGARAVGIAGGADKCRFVREELGFDDCVDHRAPELRKAIAAACPKGADVYFENVGGAVQAAVFPLLNDFGRMVMCGMVAEYNNTELAPGPNLMAAVRKRLRIEGLIVSDKPERFDEWRRLAAPWVMDGSLRYREDVVDGLDHAAEAFIGLLGGKNFGKLVVRVGAEP
ncbi:NADP-dependent oxidoreductase [Acidisphaera rubrifaciens]|uniref:Oxidoreductase n=1 Tax=Acidisphaera rubrifaciens HS-AP3 TaxID=1231350 RepID=A0A0D6P902_9PROT|nr:NADP-dependent oxidoreductase [Acidisphaera rubrifaciens]GAN77836.1 oxidoreductase [Acidisphaera rubrifaciens HS-AP3]